MAIKNVDYDGEPGVSKRFWGSNWNKDHVQMYFDHTIDYNDDGGMMVHLVRKWKRTFERAPANLGYYLRARILNAPKAWTVVILDWNSNPICLDGDVGMGTNEAPKFFRPMSAIYPPKSMVQLR